MNSHKSAFNQGTMATPLQGIRFANRGHNSSHSSTDPDQWKVHTYQLPVPLGDCSIYVLVYKKEIQNCFIMDGGTTSGKISASERIENAWKAIKHELFTVFKYTLPASQGTELKFDSWVVTHWDADHWNGVADLIWKQRRTGAQKTRRFSEFFKDNAPVLAGDFCDAWAFKDKPPKPGAPNPNGHTDLKQYGFTINDDYVGYKLIGRDLFNPKDQCTVQSGKLKWTDDKNKPRFVCLGAGGYGIGSDKLYRNDKKPSRNETSILSLLYWPASNRASYWTGGDGYPALTEHLVNNFFKPAELLEHPIEVVKLDHHGASREFSNVVNTDNIPQTFLAEPFFTMTKAARPSRVIVTPGDDYGHPCWDVILFLYCWYQAHKAEPAAKYMTPVTQGNTKALQKGKKDNTTSKKAASDPSLQKIMSVPNCADLLYTTKSPYWITNARAPDDVNITDGRVTLADKIISDHFLRNDDYNMLGLFEELWLTPRLLNHRLKPLAKEGTKEYDKELAEPLPKDWIYDKSDIEQESRDDLAAMTTEWWNWLSKQRVHRPLPGETSVKDTFYMLRMTSEYEKSRDGRIDILTPEGEDATLLKVDLEPNHPMMTRKKLADALKNKTLKSQPNWKQVKSENEEGKIEEEQYTVKDATFKGHPVGRWEDVTKTDLSKIDYDSRVMPNKNLFDGLKGFQSGWGDGGALHKEFIDMGDLIEEDNEKKKQKNKKSGALQSRTAKIGGRDKADKDKKSGNKSRATLDQARAYFREPSEYVVVQRDSKDLIDKRSIPNFAQDSDVELSDDDGHDKKTKGKKKLHK